MNKTKFFAAGLILAICILGGFFYFIRTQKNTQQFWVAFLNVGQGDAAFIQFENGLQMLVDCGANKRVLSELGKVMPLYDRTIDYLLLTHPDLDHYGGCVDVLKRYDVKNVITNGRSKTEDPYWEEFEKAVKLTAAHNSALTKPTIWKIASNTLQFISPDPELRLKTKGDDSNNYSIVFKLTNSQQSILFTGDAELPLETALVAKYCPSKDENCALQSDVLKVGHHGSDTSSGKDFLSRVKPKKSVISVGKNKFGHPSIRVVRSLQRVGSEILRTDELGAILVR